MAGSFQPSSGGQAVMVLRERPLLLKCLISSWLRLILVELAAASLAVSTGLLALCSVDGEGAVMPVERTGEGQEFSITMTWRDAKHQYQ